jgi:putative hydrolase of the HAD superfamily
MTIDAVLFDLDNTLYAQRQWLDGAWHAVAERAEAWRVDPRALERALRAVAELGTDPGAIVDAALRLVGREDVPVRPLVETFQRFAPARLEPYPGVRAALASLANEIPLGLVSDGFPAGQQAKLEALDLASCFRVVVFSDELGRVHRKPDPLPFEVALRDLGVDADRAVYIGDRPTKDVAGAAAAGLAAVRVRTGEWRNEPDDPRAWASVPTLADAAALVGAARRSRVPLAG